MRTFTQLKQSMWQAAAACITATVSLTGHAAVMNLADTPLFISSTVEPNVMLLIDTSGSMNNIIWAEAYNDTLRYPNWGFNANNGNIYFSGIPGTSCPTGWKRGTRDNVIKCLKLPDPVGGSATRYTGNYLNYLFSTYANNTDLTTGTIPNDYRMNVARKVATNLVNTTPGMRFGVASFNSTNGGRIDAACGSTASTVTTAIGSLTASSWTPLAESLYEVSRYFRGLPSYYNSGVSYTSPIQYRCQKSFTIVITDGMPTYDNDFPRNDPDDPSGLLPNWDGKATATSESMYPNFPQYSDGYRPSGAENGEGYSLFLDDIAKFAHDIDMKTSGLDLAGGSYQDAKYPKQNLYTYTVGFAASNQMLQDAAEYGKGKYFTANNAAGLASSLNQAIADIRASSSAAGAVATNTSSIQAGSLIYTAKFNSEEWSGTLFAAPINSDGVIGTPTWKSDTFLANPNADSRIIITYKPSAQKGIPFRWPANPASLTDNDLDTNQLNFLSSAAVLNYLRGDASNEGTGAGHFRRRPTTKLGDIINSSPVYVSKPMGQYENPNLFRQAYVSSSYQAFRSAQANRTPMVYVGANDGMLHGFNAGSGSDKGKEVLAFVPNQVYSNLKSLTDKSYTHKYFVDGSPTIADAEIAGAWRTVLVGGLNKGGKGIYALNVTNPANFTEARAANIVMWEFIDADLGYTFSKPMIVKANNGEWVAIFGNGYNNTVATPDASSVSATGHAVLYIVRLSDGSLIKKITTKQGSQGTPNGLATVNGIDQDLNGTVDYIYGGDLLGNMWKFDLSSSNKNNWGSAYGSTNNPEPLYQAKDAAGMPQAITTRPELSFNERDLETVMVYFGTGKYLEATDKTNAQTQTFYAIWDNGARVSSVIDRDSTILLRQTFSFVTVDQKKYRIPSNNPVDWDRHKGWYQDLPATQERHVGSPFLISGILIYSTFIPNADPCVSGGTGYLMTVNYKNGGLPSHPVLDTNGSVPGFGTLIVGGVEKTFGSGGATVIRADKGQGVAVSPDSASDPDSDNGGTGAGGSDAERLQLNSFGKRISWRELIRK